MPVDDQEPRYRLAIQDEDGNIVDRLGTLYAEADGTLKIQEGSGSFNEASLNPDGTFSVPTAPANADEVARKQEIDEKADTPHDLGGADHTADTLANLNSKVSDATLDDTNDARTPESHSGTHESGGSDVINVAGLSGELADPQPSQTQDDGTDVVASPTLNFGNGLVVSDDAGTAQVDFDGEDAGIEENIPDWQEDGNSPQTATSTDSITYTPETTFDIYYVFVQIDSSDFWEVGVQVNGDDGPNYTVRESDGTLTSDANHVLIDTISSPTNDVIGFKMRGRWGDRWHIGMNDTGAVAATIGGRNGSVTSPISQFSILETFDNNSAEEITIDVFGRDIA